MFPQMKGWPRLMRTGKVLEVILPSDEFQWTTSQFKKGRRIHLEFQKKTKEDIGFSCALVPGQNSGKIFVHLLKPNEL